MSREKELNLKQSVDSQKKEKIAEVLKLSNMVDMSKKWKWRVMPNGAVFIFRRKKGVCSRPEKNKFSLSLNLNQKKIQVLEKAQNIFIM